MERSQSGAVAYRDLFLIFLKAGFAFGGGLAILAILDEELVRKRQAVAREDLLKTYARSWRD